MNRFVPGYADELVPLVVSEVGAKARMGKILDIGSGTGNIDKLIADRFTPQSMDLVEISKPLIEESRKRLADKESVIHFHEMDAVDFVAEDDTYDSALSNLVLHNIPLERKKRVIGNVYHWLKKGGTFIWTDLVDFSDPAEFKRCLEERRDIALSMGATKEFAERNFKKEREEDHAVTVEQMTEILEQVGFIKIEVLRKKFNVVTLKAIK
ncbi:class I SAM-dependent methyltransferase [Candidatus Uhrbacteria bacterium]|nr:class I SAM-dependent methyltransferase [Candidatus Uhrbacteria bacterium]